MNDLWFFFEYMSVWKLSNLIANLFRDKSLYIGHASFNFMETGKTLLNAWYATSDGETCPQDCLLILKRPLRYYRDGDESSYRRVIRRERVNVTHENSPSNPFYTGSRLWCSTLWYWCFNVLYMSPCKQNREIKNTILSRYFLCRCICDRMDSAMTISRM